MFVGCGVTINSEKSNVQLTFKRESFGAPERPFYRKNLSKVSRYDMEQKAINNELPLFFLAEKKEG